MIQVGAKVCITRYRDGATVATVQTTHVLAQSGEWYFRVARNVVGAYFNYFSRNEGETWRRYEGPEDVAALDAIQMLLGRWRPTRQDRKSLTESL